MHFERAICWQEKAKQWLLTLVTAIMSSQVDYYSSDLAEKVMRESGSSSIAWLSIEVYERTVGIVCYTVGVHC